jgi:CheY-like chemotaxis protein
MTAIALVVGPDRAIQDEYAQQLHELAFRVYEADSLAAARQLLTEVRPDVLVTALRLQEHNGIHLAHLARATLPGLPVIIAGYADVVLQAEAASVGAIYLTTEDARTVAAAAQRAARANRPRRRWRRKQLRSPIAGNLSGMPVRLVDVSYGGFRAEVETPNLTVVTRALELHLPEFGVTADADAVWTREDSATPRYVCGASVRQEQEEIGSGWRQFVDRVLEGA